MGELLITVPVIYYFVLVILPITLFLCIILISKRIGKIDNIMDDLIQNQTTQIEQNERIIVLLEEIKEKYIKN